MSTLFEKTAIQIGMFRPDAKSSNRSGNSFGVAGGHDGNSLYQSKGTFGMGRPVGGYAPPSEYDDFEDCDDCEVEEELSDAVDAKTNNGKAVVVDKKPKFIGSFGNVGDLNVRGESHSREIDYYLNEVIKILVKEASISGSHYTQKSVGKPYKNVGKGSNSQTSDMNVSTGPYKVRSLQGKGKVTRNDQDYIKHPVRNRSASGVYGNGTDWYGFRDEEKESNEDFFDLSDDFSFNREDHVDDEFHINVSGSEKINKIK